MNLSFAPMHQILQRRRQYNGRGLHDNRAPGSRRGRANRRRLCGRGPGDHKAPLSNLENWHRKEALLKCSHYQ